MQGRFWTNEEEKFLEENYISMPTKELAEHLNRTCRSIAIKAHKLDLTKDVRGNLGLYYNPISLSKIIGISPHYIRKYTKLGYLKSDSINCSNNFNYYRYTPNQVVEFLVKYPSLWGTNHVEICNIKMLLLDYTGKDKKSCTEKVSKLVQYKC